MYSFTRQWCCSSIGHKGKVCIHNTRHLPAVSWLVLSVRSMRWAALLGCLVPSSLCWLGSIGYSILSPHRSELMAQASNPWSGAAFITVVIVWRYNRKMGKYWLLFDFYLAPQNLYGTVSVPVCLLRSLSHFCCFPCAAIHVRVCGIGWWIGSSVPIT